MYLGILDSQGPASPGVFMRSAKTQTHTLQYQQANGVKDRMLTHMSSLMICVRMSSSFVNS